MGFLIVIVILAAVVWAFLAIPWRRRQRAHAAMQDDVAEGDEIITAGGIHAVVKEAGGTGASHRNRPRRRRHPRPPRSGVVSAKLLTTRPTK